MFCKKCGAQNDNHANFCEKCGEKLGKEVNIEQAADAESVFKNAEIEEIERKRKKRKKVKMMAGALLFFLLVIGLTGFFMMKTKQVKKQYMDAIDYGNKYLEKMDYEKAEDEFLKAVLIEPKEPEPYLALLDLYLVKDEPQKAIEILEQALEYVPEENWQNVETDGENSDEIESVESIEEKLEELKGLEEYKWVVEPVIEADDIFYRRVDTAEEECFNDANKQLMHEYAIVKSQDQYGLIDFDGQLVGEIEYKYITYFAGRYILESFETNYEPSIRGEISTYILKDGQIVPTGAFDSLANENVFYYCEGLHNVVEAFSYANSHDYLKNPSHPIPVWQVEQVYSLDTFNTAYQMFEAAGKPYAVYADDDLVTGFDYEDVGAWSEGLIAVKKDGKWGYLNKKGDVMIPFEYDSSWTLYPWGMIENEKQMAYAASEGYVVLCKGSTWEVRNTEGKLVIMPGVFEKICPVYDGKCWVKKEGKWGVIQLTSKKPNEESEQNKEVLYDEEALIAKLEAVAENPIIYFLWDDYDSDGTYEAFGITASEKGEYLYTGVDIWEVNSAGKCRLLKEGLYGDLHDGMVSAGKNKYIVWELSAGGSESISYVYGVKDGVVYEPEISGKYMDFHEKANQGENSDGMVHDEYIALINDYSTGYHKYIGVLFAFDSDTGEFYETERLGNLEWKMEN